MSSLLSLRQWGITTGRLSNSRASAHVQSRGMLVTVFSQPVLARRAHRLASREAVRGQVGVATSWVR